MGRGLEVDRIIGKYRAGKGPCLFVTGGLHGNEPAGVLALQEVVQEIEERKLELKGSFYAIAGNLEGLKAGKRYLKQDLNRLWKVSILEKLKEGALKKDEDQKELNELIDIFELVEEALSTGGPHVFLDLHTTSSQSVPFIPVNDTLINRKFTKSLPVPSVLGIEEFLQGAFLSYINEYKVVALGFEAGQHEDPQSVYFHKAMVWLSLVEAGIVQQTEVPEYDNYMSRLKDECRLQEQFYEIRRRFKIEDGTGFSMLPGYESFQPILKGELLANDNSGPIRAIESGNIFMPLYQTQGSEGFFIIREVPPIWLRISSILRKIRFDDILVLLPGLNKHPRYEGTLIANTRVARFLATELFHLLGYRRKRKVDDKIFFTRREL
jgi:succinylglutamate desuccinylase